MNSEIRGECYHKIRAAASNALAKFFKKHPAYLDDERSAQEIKLEIDSTVAILQILDEYNIVERKTEERKA